MKTGLLILIGLLTATLTFGAETEKISFEDLSNETTSTDQSTAAVTTVQEVSTGGFVVQPQPAGYGTLENESIVMNFQDAPLAEVLDYLSEAAGLIIVSDSYLDQRISVVSKQPMTIDEVVSLINTILKENNYATVRTGRTLKLVAIEEAKYMNIRVTSGADPTQVTAGDEVVTHVIPIRYANAAQLREDLVTLVPEYAVFSANEASNSLILTDSTANIKRMIEIVQALDTQMSSIADVRVFHLVYADADSTADLINEIFQTQDQRNSRNQANTMNPFQRLMSFRGGAGGMFGGGPGGSGGRGGRGGRGDDDQLTGLDIPVTAAADERTNAVVVSGPSDTMEIIENVIKDLDSNPDEERSIFIYRLENAQASNLKDVLNNLFQELEQINEQNTVGGAGGARRGTAQTGRTGGMFGGGAGTTGSGSGDISDEVYFEADEDTNSLLIMTSSKNYEKIKPIIKSLDEPVPQVLIKVLLAEITVTDEFDLGTEFSLLNIQASGDFRRGVTDFNPLLDFDAADTADGLLIGITEGDFSMTLNAYQEEGNLNILSRPYILTSNNQSARINVGQRVPFITNSRETNEGQTINTIQYEDIGIILEVTPSINPNGLVIMDILPEITVTTTETVQVSESVEAAVYATRSSESRVAVRNGQTIVIGGLMQDSEKDVISKVPLLGDIPLVGELFKRTEKENEKTELLIFLTPQVAENADVMTAITEHEKSESPALNNLEANPSLEDHMNKLTTTYLNPTIETEDKEEK